jgi:hypothetical protein
VNPPGGWAGRGGSRELALVAIGYGLLTVLLIAPLALHLGSVARLDNADTRLLIWNVAWVARTLIVDPLNVFDANIFYPHQGTLAYSESNLGAGILAIPVYWATRNPYAAHNFVVLLSFVLSATSTYCLVRFLAGDRRAAAIAGICFAFCPYAFSHLPHVHLLMTAGLPLSLLAVHRVADRPTAGRGAVLGAAIAGQALFSGYYGVFVGVTVGFAVLVIAATRRLWTDARYWKAVAVAAIVAVALALPLFVPYMRLQRETGFTRSLAEAQQWSAHWRTYFASSAYAHAWMLPLIRHWNEVLFPGFVALLMGTAGFVVGWRRGGRWREVSVLYGGLAVVAFWASLGPDAGLYRVLNAAVPAFSLLRAPSRFGMVVALALSVLAGVAISALLAKIRRPAAAAAVASIMAATAVLELAVPLSFSPVPPIEKAYRVLATLPRGPVLELPFYSWRFASARTQYMLNSTAHWMPLVNGYSSYTPQDFIENTPVLGGFPTPESFRLLERDRVRYVIFHMSQFSPDARQSLAKRLREYDRYLERRYADDRIHVYEIVGFPR